MAKEKLRKGTIYYVYKKITVKAGKEKVEDIIISTEAEPKRALAITCDEGTDIDLLAYVEREKIVDIPTTHTPRDSHYIDVDIDLPIGQRLSVGFRNGTGTDITYNVSVKYIIV